MEVIHIVVLLAGWLSIYLLALLISQAVCRTAEKHQTESHSDKSHTQSLLVGRQSGSESRAAEGESDQNRMQIYRVVRFIAPDSTLLSSAALPSTAAALGFSVQLGPECAYESPKFENCVGKFAS